MAVIESLDVAIMMVALGLVVPVMVCLSVSTTVSLTGEEIVKV